MNDTVSRHVSLQKSALLDHLSEAILVVSRKGELFAVNSAGLKLLSLTGRSIKKLKEILFSELSLPKVLEARDATEIKLRKLNIADHTYIIDSFFDGEDLVILLSDITDVKKMAEDLSQQFTHLLRFKMSMQCITDGIVVADAFERVVFMNATMHDIISSQHKKYDVRTLKDLELLLGIFSENEEGASLSESSYRDEKTGQTFLAEKRKLMISGERLHGFLIYFSAVSAEEGKPLKNSLKTAQTPLSELRYPPAGNRKGAEKPSIQSFVGQSKSVLRIKATVPPMFLFRPGGLPQLAQQGHGQVRLRYLRRQQTQHVVAGHLRHSIALDTGPYRHHGRCRGRIGGKLAARPVEDLALFRTVEAGGPDDRQGEQQYQPSQQGPQ